MKLADYYWKVMLGSVLTLIMLKMLGEISYGWLWVFAPVWALPLALVGMTLIAGAVILVLFVIALAVYGVAVMGIAFLLWLKSKNHAAQP